MKIRGSGILLHITSLPSPFGIGDLGPEAYRFADFLSQTSQSYWQVLPLNPIEVGTSNSPYVSSSALAGNPLLISPELLLRDGLLESEETEQPPIEDSVPVDYPQVHQWKKSLFEKAHARFEERNERRYEYEKFCSDNAGWLEDFSLFTAVKDHFRGRAWSDWPVELRDRKPNALESMAKSLARDIRREKFLQFVFFKQWSALKEYCHQRGIRIFGDLAIYVNYNSTDVWANPHIFKLDDAKRPYVVSGVPPDYFSETGQLWGNPIYRWDELRASGYEWWMRRMVQNLKLFDITRIDHFRGLVAFWEVPASEKTAINGKWVEAPVDDFLKALFKKFPSALFVAEDLGLITPDVREVIHRFDLPGMKVLLFAFGEGLPSNPYIPHNLTKNCILYTGTHDNNTVRGWFEKEAGQDVKNRLFQYLGREVGSEEIHWELIRMAMMSVAAIVIFPMQDLLGLGADARMNTPALRDGNWRWRLPREWMTSELGEKLGIMTEIYGRT